MFIARFLFWTDSSPKIERLDLANDIRQTIVNNTYLQLPTTLVIDFVTRRLLWLDSAASRIGFVNFDGSGLSFWSMQLFSSISSFVIFKVITMTFVLTHYAITSSNNYWQELRKLLYKFASEKGRMCFEILIKLARYRTRY